MTKTVVVGKRSFIGNTWASTNPSNVTLLARADLSESHFGNCEIVVNCAINAAFKSGPYKEALDDDLSVARIVASTGKHFVMLSTRKVYGIKATRDPISESTSTTPNDHYGANKLESERRVRSILGDRCTILRISNVFGYELGRRSFFGIALGRLRREGIIELDISPFVSRDFIPVEFLVTRLEEICVVRPAGIFNLGSGVGIQLGRIAEWLIRGYGRGQLLVSVVEEKDSFLLNVNKLKNALQFDWPPIEFESLITSLGSRLKNA